MNHKEEKGTSEIKQLKKEIRILNQIKQYNHDSNQQSTSSTSHPKHKQLISTPVGPKSLNKQKSDEGDAFYSAANSNFARLQPENKKSVQHRQNKKLVQHRHNSDKNDVTNLTYSFSRDTFKLLNKNFIPTPDILGTQNGSRATPHNKILLVFSGSHIYLLYGLFRPFLGLIDNFSKNELESRNKA